MMQILGSCTIDRETDAQNDDGNDRNTECQTGVIGNVTDEDTF